MIKIQKLNNGFKVEGIDNVLYPDNGTLVFGPNTVILVTDESDMVTFRSASNFDVLFSGLIDNITIDGESVTKDNIVEKFQAVANVVQGSQEDVNSRLEQIESEVALKVDQETFDTKEEVISKALNDLHESIPTVPTNVSEFTNDAGYITQNDIANKQDKLTAGENITIENNVISSTGGTQVQADWNQSDVEAVDYIKNKPTFPDTSEFVTKTEYNPKEQAIAEALTNLNENKADKTELPVVPDMANYYTKQEIDNMVGNINTILASI